MADLHARVRAGEVSADQANIEARTLATILNAYDSAELKQRVDALTSIVDRKSHV